MEKRSDASRIFNSHSYNLLQLAIFMSEELQKEKKKPNFFFVFNLGRLSSLESQFLRGFYESRMIWSHQIRSLNEKMTASSPGFLPRHALDQLMPSSQLKTRYLLKSTETYLKISRAKQLKSFLNSYHKAVPEFQAFLSASQICWVVGGRPVEHYCSIYGVFRLVLGISNLWSAGIHLSDATHGVGASIPV